MKVMLLAAGRGNRLRPWTDNTPKPLLTVAEKPLIIHQIEKLVAAGFDDIVINLSYLGEQIEQILGNGKQLKANIQYSHEQTALETGGGVYRALPLLGPKPFLVVNADIYTDFPFKQVPHQIDSLGHLILVNNPEHHKAGDYVLNKSGKIELDGNPKFTFSGIGIYHPDLFHDCQDGIFRLPKVFETAIATRQLSGEIYNGLWCDVGTVDRWQALEKIIAT